MTPKNRSTITTKTIKMIVPMIPLPMRRLLMCMLYMDYSNGVNATRPPDVLYEPLRRQVWHVIDAS